MRCPRYAGKLSCMPDVTALKARYVFPGGGEPIAGGHITFSGDILTVGSASDVLAEDLGDVAIIPGLVNAHTHLEFSDLEAPLGEPGMPLPDWIRLVVSRRDAAADQSTKAIYRGLEESVARGTAMLGEISTQYLPFTCETSGPDQVVFRELIAPTAARMPDALDAAQRFLQMFPANESAQPGLSPHAPYTVHPVALDRCVELSRRQRIPLAMHLAESPEELELLRSGSGPFRQLLEEFGAWDSSLVAAHSKPLNYLRKLVKANRALIIHGNYLDPLDEMVFLSEHRATMSVVYCPRTHAYFRHERYPLGRMLSAGVNVAVGTDSRASNPDLSVFEELKHIARTHHDVRPETILEMGTQSGARALGADQVIGELQAAKAASFTVVEIGPRRATDPYDLLLADSAQVVQTWWRGKKVFDARL